MSGNVNLEHAVSTAAQNPDAPPALMPVGDECRPLLNDDDRTTYSADDDDEAGLHRKPHEYEPKSNSSKSTFDTAIIITIVSFITGVSSLLAGLVVVAIPTIVDDFDLPPHLKLWPASIFSLTCGCTLLLSGAISDVVGGTRMFLLGCFLQTLFTLGCGLAPTATQFLVYRALAGVATSFCLPSAVSVINHTFPPGKRRSWAFASMGGGQPVGFATGLLFGGIFIHTIGWRWGFYVAAIVNGMTFFISLWRFPTSGTSQIALSWHRAAFEIDWIGAIIASISLGLLFYILAIMTDDMLILAEPFNAIMLTVSILLLPAFVLWVGRQERLHRPALIPNSLWRNEIFTGICINVFLTWGAFNAFELILTLFFQEVQRLGPLDTALRFLPQPISGMAVFLVMGFTIHRVRADYTMLAAGFVASAAQFLMAIARPSWSYWLCAFPAVLLNPLGADALFTISNLLITSVFPGHMQGLAGGVFNTISQVGKSVGIALVGLTAEMVTRRSKWEDKQSPEALVEGYSAAFWLCLGMNVVTLFVSGWTLRNIGMVGKK